MSLICDLCGECDDERSMYVWRNGILCHRCNDYFTEEELKERGFTDEE